MYKNLYSITILVSVEKIHSLVNIVMENFRLVDFQFKPGVKNMKSLMRWLGSRYLLKYIHHTGTESVIKLQVVTRSHAMVKITDGFGSSFQRHV